MKSRLVLLRKRLYSSSSINILSLFPWVYGGYPVTFSTCAVIVAVDDVTVHNLVQVGLMPWRCAVLNWAAWALDAQNANILLVRQIEYVGLGSGLFSNRSASFFELLWGAFENVGNG